MNYNDQIYYNIKIVMDIWIYIYIYIFILFTYIYVYINIYIYKHRKTLSAQIPTKQIRISVIYMYCHNTTCPCSR